jgi:putative heme iron utilization protein
MNRTNELPVQAGTLLRSRTFGVLATNSTQVAGTPSASVVAYALDSRDRPVFLLSTLALHTQNLRADSRASLLVFEPETESAPLTSARLNLFGDIAELPESDAAVARELYLKAHPDAEQWIDFGDFALYRMAVARAYYVGGFGVMGWMDLGEKA